MKVMFVASNPADEVTLNLEREITELQRRFSEVSGEPVAFSFLPGLNAEDLPGEISRRKPDVLHISAHGTEEQLSLSNAAGKRVALDAEALAAFLPPDRSPRLVYLNACDSEGIAAALAQSGAVSMAIGSTAPITNRAARAGALAFYERLLAGTPVQHAYDVGRKMIEMLQDKQASTKLHPARGVNPATEILHRIPRLIADFVGGDTAPNKWEQYSVRFGLVGCSANTRQVVFFTDDESFIDDEEDNPAVDLCVVVRDAPVSSVLWVDPDKGWDVQGDFRLFATGVTGDATSFTVASMLCDAIEARYRLAGNLPSDVANAVARLRRENGAELDISQRVERLARHGRKPTKARPPGSAHTAARVAVSAKSGASRGATAKKKAGR